MTTGRYEHIATTHPIISSQNLIMFSVLLFCICWLVPASIVYAITDFTFFDSCYFSMVTFTTVGFGDLTITGYNLKFVIVAFSYFG